MAITRETCMEVASQCHTALARAGGYGAEITSPALPFLAQSGAAGAVFIAGLAGFQYAGYVCGISCVTPALGPLFGCAAVGISSAAAGQAAAAMHRLMEGGNLWPRDEIGAMHREEMMLHALMGIVGFKALGGSFRNVMPSNLGYPGALAKFSIPAKGEAYAVEAERAVIKRMFKQFGCHHCGRRSGGCIADHMPPNKQVVVMRSAFSIRGLGLNLLRFFFPTKGRMKTRAKNVLTFKGSTGNAGQQSKGSKTAILSGAARVIGWGAKDGQAGAVGRYQGEAVRNSEFQIVQRFYPQCESCSQKQALAMKQDRHVLVMHLRRGQPESFHLAGLFIGALYTGCHRGEGQLTTRLPQGCERQSIGRWNEVLSGNQLLSDDGWTSDPVEEIKRLKQSLGELRRSKVCNLEVEVEELRLREKKLRETLHGTRAKLFRSGSNATLQASLKKEEQLLEVQLERVAAQKKLLKEKIRWLKWES